MVYFDEVVGMQSCRHTVDHVDIMLIHADRPQINSVLISDGQNLYHADELILHALVNWWVIMYIDMSIQHYLILTAVIDRWWNIEYKMV